MPAQITLTAQLDQITGNSDVLAALRITLVNYGTWIPRISGTSMIAKAQYVQKQTDPSNPVSITLWGNDVITPSGTFYCIEVIDSRNVVVQAGNYLLTGGGTQDLSNLTPLTPLQQGELTPIWSNPPGESAQTIHGNLVIENSGPEAVLELENSDNVRQISSHTTAAGGLLTFDFWDTAGNLLGQPLVMDESTVTVGGPNVTETDLVVNGSVTAYGELPTDPTTDSNAALTASSTDGPSLELTTPDTRRVITSHPTAAGGLWTFDVWDRQGNLLGQPLVMDESVVTVGGPNVSGTDLVVNGDLTVHGSIVGSGGAEIVTVEHNFTAAGSFAFAHNLNTKYPVFSCLSKGPATSFKVQPNDANSLLVTVPAAADIVCSFVSPSSAPPPPPGGSFSFDVTGVPTLYSPTLAPTGTMVLTIAQISSGSFTSTVTYSVSGLPTGITAVISPTTITGGSGSTTLTLTIANTAPSGDQSFTVTGTDGKNPQNVTVTLTIDTINDGLVEAWGMHDGTATMASAIRSNNLTGTNIAWATANGVEWAQFNQASSVATAADGSRTNFSATTPFSVCAAIALNNLNTTNTWVIVGNYTNSGYGWVLFTADNMTGLLQGSTGSINKNTNAFASAGSLTFVCWTYDGSGVAAGVQLYINGVVSLRLTPDDNLSGTLATTTPVSIGGIPSGVASQFFGGGIGNVRIYDRVLTQAEITALNATLGA